MYRNPTPTVDVLVIDNKNRVLLIQRGRDPFRGYWAIPGGFIEYGETVENAAVREVSEETGLTIELLEVLGVYSAPDRDPRKHIITIVFIARPVSGELKSGDDAESAKWFELSELQDIRLAFDHGVIIADLKRWFIRGGTYWSTKQRSTN